MISENLTGSFVLIYTVLPVVTVLLMAKWLMGKNTAYKKRDLQGKTIILTGASSGIGYEVAVDLVKRGPRLIIAVLSKQEGEETCRKLRQSSGNSDVSYKIMDLASFKSIHAFVDDVKRTERHLDVLINNAAVMLRQHEETEDGLDRTLQVNYFGPFLLTNLLLDLLEKSQSARIIHVTTGFAVKYAGGLKINHLNHFDTSVKTYCRSKLYLRLFNYELAKRLANSNVDTFSVHPGDCYTNLFTDMSALFKFFTRIWMLSQRSVKKASEAIIHCIDADDLQQLSGKHFENLKPTHHDAPIETNSRLSEDLWIKSMEIVKLPY